MIPLSLTLAQMLPESRHQLLRSDLEGVADPQQREYRAGPSRFDHLPVADGEAQADHVLLAEPARRPVLADAMAQRAEEPRVPCRKLSAGAHDPILRGARAKIPRAKMRIHAMILARINTFMPAVQRTRNRATAYRVRLSACCALTFALCLAFSPQMHGQSPLFADTPDRILRYLVAAHPEMPAQTSFDIAVIETNAPGYFASSDKGYRCGRVEALIAIEAEQVKGSPDLQRYWYEFLEAKGPALTESEIDAIARQWWSDNGNRAETHDDRGVSKIASFTEVRMHFQIFRTGNEAQVRAARNWLMMAQMGDHRERFRLPPQMQGMSPLAHLLARDITKEATVYTGEEGEKLRRTVRSLLADKFMTEGDAGIAHLVSSADVDAALDDLLSDNEGRKHSAQELLEEWLRRAIDTDLKRFAAGDANSHWPH